MPKRAAALGLLAFLAVFLPLRLWRASRENSLWIDETASFMLASHPVSVLLDWCAVDTNPPGYFLALKAWLKLGRLFLGEPGILWARALGTLAWLVFAAGVWWLGRSLVPAFSQFLLLAVAGSAYAAVSANDARGYSFATAALFLCALLLLDLYAHPELSRRQAAVRWLLFALAASVALWTHLLSAPVFALLALLFAALARRRGTLDFAGGGALAIVIAALSFLPGALAVRAGIGSLQASAVTWMTPATVPNLLSVFVYWYPFGRVGGPSLGLEALGAASFLLPAAAALIAARRRRGAADPVLLLLAAAGFGIAVVFVGFLWLVQRYGLMTVFHAPRYPALTAAFWAAGIVALAAWATRRAGWRRSAAWLLVAPWLLCAFAGQVWAIAAERTGGLQEMRARFTPYLPARGGDLYVLPSELIPFFRDTFADYRLRRIEELPCALPRRSSATVLDLNFWHVLDRPRDLIARHILESGLESGGLSASREEASFPDWRRDYAVLRLSGLDRAAGEALCRRGLGPTPRPIPPDAMAVALPENQEYGDGWSFPEVAPDLSIRRWASRRTSVLRFDRPVPPGAYTLHLRGYNPASPTVPATLRLAIPAGSGPVSRNLGEGEFEIVLPLQSRQRHRRFAVHLTRPTWSPQTATGASDARVLTVLFEYAWLEGR